MKKKNQILTAALVLGISAASMAQSLNFNWVKSIGNANNAGETLIENDAQGNTYISGLFTGTIDFDPGPGVFNLTSQNATFGDNYLLKLDANGNFLWVKQWNLNPTNNSQVSNGGFSFKVNQNGIFITGAFTGTTDFNPGSAVSNLTCNGNTAWDAYLLKLDLNGNLIWVQNYGGTSIDCGRNFAFDSNNNIYLIGYFSGTADFDFSPASNSLTSNGAADVFILKLNQNGSFIWVKKIGGPANDDFGSLEIDSQGNIYYGGNYFASNPIDIDPGPGVFNLTNNGNWDIPLAKLDANGNFLWALSIGNSGQNRGVFKLNSLTDQIILFGTFSGILDIDPSPIVNNIASNGADDNFLIAINNSGNYVWSSNFGGAGNEIGGLNGQLSFDSNGKILITGTFSQSVDFDPGINTNIINSAGLKDIYVSIFSATGNYITTKTFGNAGDDVGTGIATYPPDNIYLTGLYSNTVDFDPNNGVANLTSAGQFDTYILKLNSSFCGYTTYDTVTVYNTVTIYDTVTTYISVTDTLIINTGIAGLNPPNNQNTILVFPNPTNDYITINYGNFALMAGYQLRIENTLGQQVFQTNITQQSDYLPLSTWGGNGLYFVRIIDPQGNTTELRKIILE